MSTQMSPLPTRQTQVTHKILVAEDNRVMANVLQFNLTKAGYDVSVANSGSQAVELASHTKFDLVITDYQMPGLSGEEVCERLRARPEYKLVPIFMCSAKGYELDVVDLCEKYRLAGIIRKPFSPLQILELVSSQLLKPAAGTLS